MQLHRRRVNCTTFAVFVLISLIISGGLLLRESLLEEAISDFGQGWNKNNFPLKIVKIAPKGRMYLES